MKHIRPAEVIRKLELTTLDRLSYAAQKAPRQDATGFQQINFLLANKF